MFAYDKKEGKGKFSYADGRVFNGEWCEGLQHRLGIEKTSEEGGDMTIGVWKRGKLV